MSDPNGNVVAALAAVVADLPGIGKDGRGPRDQGGYAYRGIEQITREAAPLLAKHGVVFVPQVVAMEIRDLVVAGKPWTDTILTVRYRIYGPGGPAMRDLATGQEWGDCIEAVVVGIGRDNSDKGANKALTQAFKYALTQVLCISDSNADADGQTHEADPAPAVQLASKLDVDVLTTDIEAAAPAVREAFVAWKNDQSFPWPWPSAAVTAMHRKLAEITGEPSPGNGPTGDDGEVAASPVLSGSDTAGGAVSLPLIPDEGRGVNATTGDGPHSADQRPDPHGYALWPKLDLLAECAEREIDMPKSATNERMVTALRVWDQTYAPDAVEPTERPF